MIDTIAITLHEGQFEIMKHDRFSPSTYNLYYPPYIKVTGRSPFKAVNNPTVEDKQKYGYLPRLTIYKAIRAGGFTTFLRVEFSAPKLLFGNNFDEVDRNDFSKLLQTLHRKLFLMGISVRDMSCLRYAEVSAIHYSKNIILTDYSTPSSIIGELSKANISQSKDVSYTDYRNEGHVYKYHSNNFEVVFYDKLADLKQAKKSEKRAIEKDNYVQLGLFDQVQVKQPFEVLRMEVRLGDRKKIKQVLAESNLTADTLNLNYLFAKRVAKKLLLSTMGSIAESCIPILGKELTNEQLLVQIQISYPRISYRKLLSILGARQLMQELGVRRFRKATERFGGTNWYRLSRELKELKASSARGSNFGVLYEQLSSFRKTELELFANRV